MNFPSFRIRLWKMSAGVILVLLAQLVVSQEIRIFTNKDGEKIEAEFLEVVNGDQVQIKRTSDSRQFTLPISSLSLDDQQFLANYLKRQSGILDAEAEGSLLVSTPNLRDRLFPITDRSTWGSSVFGASTHRFTVPKGTWICYNPEEIYGRFFIPYLGESSWQIRLGENDTVWLSRDNGKEELVGVPLTRSDEAEIQQRIYTIEKNKVRHVLNLACQDIDFTEHLDSLPGDLPLAVSLDERISLTAIEHLSSHNVIALYGKIDASLTSELKQLENLKYLCLEADSLGENDLLELPAISGLEHLGLINGATHVAWDDSLAAYPNLRSLATFRTRNESGKPGTPITSFSGNPYLNFLALHNRDGEYFNASALNTASTLAYLKLEQKDIRNPYKDLTPLLGLKRLKYLYSGLPDFPLELLDQCCESGSLSHLRDLTTYQIPQVELLPSLKSLTLFRSESSGPLREFTRLDNLPDSVKKLRIHWLPIGNAKMIHLPHPESIECLHLISTTIPNSEFLYQFSGVRYFNFAADNGNVTQIDFSNFPELEYANISGIQKLSAVQNLTSLQKMERLILRNSDRLSDLGKPVGNTSLQDIALANLPLLESLDSLSQVKGLQYLALDNCDALTSYSTILDNNELIRLTVRKCDKLPDVTKVPQ